MFWTGWATCLHGERVLLETFSVAELSAALAVGERVSLTQAWSRREGKPLPLELRRVQVFTPDAVVVEVTESGERYLAPPRNVYFAGQVRGEPRSRAFLSLREDGEVRGIVVRETGQVEFLGSDERPVRWGERLEFEPVTQAALERAAAARPFACATDEIWDPASLLEELTVGSPQTGMPPEPLVASFTARVAVETDHEFYLLFNNTQRATNYIGDLIGFSSLIYEAETNTSLNAHWIRIWTTPADPWTETSSLCGLLQLGSYWNLNMGSVSRTTVHMMSGKATGGGVAWVGVLCSGPFNFSASCAFCNPNCSTALVGGAYGFTGNMAGNFSPNNPASVWDIIAVSHEIGHNFNSPHTHCYAGIDGNPSDVDHCYGSQSGCYSGATSLPGLNSTTGGTPGSGNGTLMSYCHLLPGSYANISLTFGQSHPYGVAAGRVPTRMSQHVTAVAGSNPSCLAYTPQDYIFADSFESGNTSRWLLGP